MSVRPTILAPLPIENRTTTLHSTWDLPPLTERNARYARHGHGMTTEDRGAIKAFAAQAAEFNLQPGDPVPGHLEEPRKFSLPKP